MAELLPCPFCGVSDVTLASSVEWFVYCSNPLCDTSSNTADGAAKAWNTRADGWQPIDTAPRDGTDVDLWVKLDGTGIRYPGCCYDTEDGQWYWWDNTKAEPSSMASLTITHWRSIPKAPEGML